MSYGKLLNDTIRITGKNWWLWLFGFFISIGGAAANLPRISEHINTRNVEFLSRDWLPAIALGLMLLGLVIGLIYLVLKVIAECSLMVAVQDIAAGGRGALVPSFQKGLPFFWRILGLVLLVLLIVLTALLFFAMIVAFGFIATPILGVLLLVIMIPLLLVAMFIIEAVAAWAFRAVVIDKQLVFTAIGDGWRLFRRKLGPTILVGLLAVASQIVFSVAGLIVIAIVGIPFLMAGLVNIWLGLIPAVLFGIPILCVFEGFTGTYSSALWTLAYLELRDEPGNQPTAPLTETNPA